jgi:hypothetical protein
LLRIASCQTNRLFILLERAEKEIRFSIANGMFKPKMDIDRYGPRLMPNSCKDLNPPYFSLPSTFKQLIMQTVHIIQLSSVSTDSLPKEGFLQGNPNLLPTNLARQWYRYTSVPMEAAAYFITHNY